METIKLTVNGKTYEFKPINKSISDLLDRKDLLAQISINKGVYVVAAQINKNKKYTIDEAKDEKDKNSPKYEVSRIENIVNRESNVINKKYRLLYIGKADGKRGLQQRLKQYIKSTNYIKTDSNNYNGIYYKGHRGGRAVWQINEKDKLFIFICEQKINPETLESDLIEKYGIEKLLNMRKQRY